MTKKQETTQLPVQIDFQGKLSQSSDDFLKSLPISEPKELIPLEVRVDIYETTESWNESDEAYSSWSRDSSIEIVSISNVIKNKDQDKSTTNEYISDRRVANDYETTVLWTNKDELLVDGQDIHLVYARYGSGDSFGHHSGQLHIIAAFTDPDVAKQTLERFEDSKNIVSFINGKDGYDDSSKYYAISNSQICSEYVPWNGYFERLESLELDTFPLKLHELTPAPKKYKSKY